MRYRLTVFVCKWIMLLIKLLGKKATTTPGQIALKLCPSILTRLSKGVKKDIVAVFGTNGKTTTNNLLCDYLEKEGFSVISNRFGANMKTGVVSAFLEKAGWFGKVNADFACLEMDEAWAKHIVRDMRVNVIVIGNLFRDQLDRYGEIEMTMTHLKTAIRNAPHATLIANGDDPLVYATVEEFDNEKLFFGIPDAFSDGESTANEGKYCYHCGKMLTYDFYHFNQLGAYRCDCGFKRPELTYKAQNIRIFPSVSFDVADHGTIALKGRGVYNIYNILASMAGALRLGASFETVQKCAESYKPQVGRLEEFKIGEKSVYLLLSKNPVGFNQSVNSVIEDPRTKDVLIAINDRPQDGQDVSWLWDVSFEKLIESENVKSFVTSGMRYADMALRLKYGGVPGDTIYMTDKIREAVEHTLKGDAQTAYLLVNYTVLFETQAVLKELENK